MPSGLCLPPRVGRRSQRPDKPQGVMGSGTVNADADWDSVDAAAAQIGDEFGELTSLGERHPLPLPIA